MNGTITRRMENALDGLGDQFKEIYNTKDFEEEIKKLKSAFKSSRKASELKNLFKMLDSYNIEYKKNEDFKYYENLVKQHSLDFEEEIEKLKSAFKSSRKESELKNLFKMLDSCNIEYKKNEDFKYYENLVKQNSFFTWKEYENNILFELLKIYNKFPTPQQYIQRLVDRLSYPEDHWENDTLRLRILKQFIKYGNYLKGRFGGYTGGAYIEKKYKKENGIDKKCNNEDVIEWITDDIFDVLKGKKHDEIKEKYSLLKAVDDLANGRFRTGGSTKKFLYLFAMVYNMTFYFDSNELLKIYQNYDDASKYMEDLVEKISLPQDKAWQDDSLRLRILKQFIKYSKQFNDDCEIYTGRNYILNRYAQDTGACAENAENADIIQWLDDDIFDVLDECGKEEIEEKYSLLQAVNDISNAKFNNRAGKNLMNLFNEIYSINSNTAEGETPRFRVYKSDIEVNLFIDYYGAEMMNYIDECYKNNSSDFENPTGQGINYKNYAEMVYIYYISKTGMSAKEKIKKATKMIEELKKEGKEFEYANVQNETILYRNLYVENILSKDEEAFKEFIKENYNIRAEASKGVLQIETEQNTAFKEYKKIREKIKDLLNDGDLSDINYGLCFVTDIKEDRKQALLEACKSNIKEVKKMNITPQSVDEFMRLIEKADKWIKDSKEKGADDVTRADIIINYYKYYNLCFEQSEYQTFENVWNSFSLGVNKILEKCFYQPINGRNLFDIFIVLSSYDYLNF